MALSDLLPASFRGVPFAVLRSGGSFGRRLNVHQYPGRDTPWAEDLGRGARRYRFAGFILEGDLVYGGGPIDLQRALLIAAAEGKGTGILTHPTLGVLTVCCDGLSISDELEAGTYAEIEFSFVEAGAQLYPSLVTDTLDAVKAAVGDAGLAIVSAAGGALTSRLSTSPSSQRDIPVATAAWTAQVTAAGADATAALSLTARLSGPFGRYAAGATQGFAAGTAYVTDATVADVIATGAAERAAIAASGAGVSTVAFQGGAAALGGAVLSQVQTLVAACADPADAVRLLTALRSSSPAATTPVQQAVGDLYRRAVVVSLASASSAYQPSSYDDAVALLAKVTAALDAEITVAGDQAADDAFQALRSVRRAVVGDLTTRGAALARMATFQVGASLPDVVLAQRLYRDPSRAAQITQQVGEVHPLFMPSTFRALAA